MGNLNSVPSEFQDTLPNHWAVLANDKKREALSSFYNLLNGYDEHLTRSLSKKKDKEHIVFPRSIDDKDFDDFILKSYTTRPLQFPSLQSRELADWILNTIIHMCLKKKYRLIHMGASLVEENDYLEKLLLRNYEIQLCLANETQKNQDLIQKMELLKKQDFQHSEHFSGDKSNKRDVIEKGTRREHHSQDTTLVRKIGQVQDGSLLDKGVHNVKEQHHTPEWKRLATEQEERSNDEIRNLRLKLQEERAKVLELSKKVTEFQKEKEHLLVRLSHAVGSKLTSNNPAIADLSDENRPNKLAERFGQIYDNEWTDAFEELTQQSLQVKEEVAIDFLLRTAMTAYQFCAQFRCMFLVLGDCCTIVTCDDPSGMRLLHRFGLQDSATIDLEKNAKRILHINRRNIISEVQKNFLATMMDMIQDLADHDEKCRNMADEEVKKPESLKHISPESKTDIKLSDTHNAPKGTEEEGTQSLAEAAKGGSDKQGSMSARDSRSRVEIVTTKEEQKQAQTAIPGREMSPSLIHKFASTIRYLERVVELCWLMQTSKPAIHLSATIPDSGAMDKNLFKAYTKTGPRIDYIVWPVMYLYENGPLLSQGVAQPKRINP